MPNKCFYDSHCLQNLQFWIAVAREEDRKEMVTMVDVHDPCEHDEDSLVEINEYKR